MIEILPTDVAFWTFNTNLTGRCELDIETIVTEKIGDAREFMMIKLFRVPVPASIALAPNASADSIDQIYFDALAGQGIPARGGKASREVIKCDPTADRLAKPVARSGNS